MLSWPVPCPPQGSLRDCGPLDGWVSSAPWTALPSALTRSQGRGRLLAWPGRWASRGPCGTPNPGSAQGQSWPHVPPHSSSGQMPGPVSRWCWMLSPGPWHPERTPPHADRLPFVSPPDCRQGWGDGGLALAAGVPRGGGARTACTRHELGVTGSVPRRASCSACPSRTASPCSLSRAGLPPTGTAAGTRAFCRLPQQGRPRPGWRAVRPGRLLWSQRPLSPASRFTGGGGSPRPMTCSPRGVLLWRTRALRSCQASSPGTLPPPCPLGRRGRNREPGLRSRSRGSLGFLPPGPRPPSELSRLWGLQLTGRGLRHAGSGPGPRRG